LNGNFGFLQVVFVLLSRFYMPRYDVRMNQTIWSYFLRKLSALSLRQMLKYQIKMLRDRIDEPRIITEEVERAELMRLGALIDHQIFDVMLVVKPKTYRVWLRKKAGKKPKRKGGRPETEAGTIQLIIRLATENLGWGYKRIFGELNITACEANGKRTFGLSRRDATAKQGTTWGSKSVSRLSAIS
jgi:putative transposase